MATPLPEAPIHVAPEVAQVYAERNLRSQHKYRMGWSKADQADENRWTRHDNEHAKQTGFRYGTCPLCHTAKETTD